MRFRLALALSISILLIGAASWSRISSHKTTKVDLIAVENRQAENNAYYNDVIVPALEESATSSAPTEALTGTDLIGRQLILDYVNLASNGQADEDNLKSLAERYIDSVPTLNSAPIVSPEEISVVPDKIANIQKYADNLSRIHAEYSGAINKAGNEMIDMNKSGPDYYAFAQAASSIYSTTVNKLKALSVPAPLVESHIRLINSYLANSTSMQAVARANTDSATAFAGLIALNDNSGKERDALDEITRIINSYGI
jgi:hypothetical protein